MNRIGLSIKVPTVLLKAPACNPTRQPVSRTKIDTVQFSGKPVEKTLSGLSKPAALKPGDTIALVAPATPLSPDGMKETIRQVEVMGFHVKNYAPTTRYRQHYLSASDEDRAKALNKAFRDPDVKAIFAVEGGGGSFRPGFLNHLDWNTIRKHPKIITGYSDITFLHHALYNKVGLVTFHTPVPAEFFRKPQKAKAFWRMVSPKIPASLPLPIRPGKGKDYKCFVSGQATGELVGGNLSLLATTVGTPYQVDLNRKILFLEDWNESYEAIDRKLSHLALNGMWDRIRGLILGEFHGVPRDTKEYRDLTPMKFFRQMTTEARKRGIPVGYNFPIGHGANNHSLPMGVQAHFDSVTGKLTFLESPLSST